MKKSNLFCLALALGLLAEGHAAAAATSVGGADIVTQIDRTSAGAQ